MSTPNTHSCAFRRSKPAEFGLLNGVSTIRSARSWRRPGATTPPPAKLSDTGIADARRAQIIGEHAATIASQVIES
jgi:hypothetical protein